MLVALSLSLKRLVVQMRFGRATRAPSSLLAEADLDPEKLVPEFAPTCDTVLTH
jgi:hypothetical protein